MGDVASLEEGNATYGEALRSMFQVLDMNIASLEEDNTSGVVTIHPELGSYYALDGEIGGNLIVRDKSSFYFTELDTAAYLVFEIDLFGEAVFIQASSRYIYNSENGSYESDPNWYQSQWLKINQDQTIVLVGSAGEATQWFIADANGLIDVSVTQGSDFNTSSTSWQTNSIAAYPTNNDGELSAWNYYDSGLKTNQFYNNVDDDYQNQLGHSESASVSASAVLDIIEEYLATNGTECMYLCCGYIQKQKKKAEKK